MHEPHIIHVHVSPLLSVDMRCTDYSSQGACEQGWTPNGPRALLLSEEKIVISIQ